MKFDFFSIVFEKPNFQDFQMTLVHTMHLELQIRTLFFNYYRETEQPKSQRIFLFFGGKYLQSRLMYF